MKNIHDFSLKIFNKDTHTEYSFYSTMENFIVIIQEL